MICVFEPVCSHGEHAQFNAAMLMSASELSKDGLVTFLGESNHLNSVAECLPVAVAAKVKFQQVDVASRHLRAFISRFLIELPLLSRVWRAVRESRSEMLFITGVTEPGLLAIKLFFLFHPPQIPIVVVFHSILPQFLYSQKRQLLLGALVPKNVVYVVLGKHILHELGKISPWIRNRISTITHPYIFEQHDTSAQKISVVPKFAFVGLANNNKGFPDFLLLIEQFNKRVASNIKPRFYFIGSVSNECIKLFEDFKKTDDSSSLWFPLKTGKLPLDIYRQKISEVDYIIMPHSIDAYKLVFSGSSLDALLLLKPIIALRSSFFEEFFDQLGDIGYLCNDIAEMSDLIVELSQNPAVERYRLQTNNLHKGRLFFDPSVVAIEIKSLTS